MEAKIVFYLTRQTNLEYLVLILHFVKIINNLSGKGSDVCKRCNEQRGHNGK